MYVAGSPASSTVNELFAGHGGTRLDLLLLEFIFLASLTGATRLPVKQV